MPTDLATALTAYDQQLRTSAEMQGATDVTRLGPLWLGVLPGERGFVTYAPPGRGDAERLAGLVPEALGEFRRDPRIVEVEWKTRSHDVVPGLREALERERFDEGDPESVMVGDARSLIVDLELPEGVTLRRVTDEDGVRIAVATWERVFGNGAWQEMVPRLVDRVTGGDEGVELWIAQAGSDVIGSARLEDVPGTQFAGLWGGAMLPRWRGRGIYRALTAARARSALAWGRQWLHSDSTPMSRPILERSGMVRVTGTTPWTWRRPAYTGARDRDTRDARDPD